MNPQQDKQSAAVRLRELAAGYWLSQCVAVVAELGIADLLNDGPKPVDELVRQAEPNPGRYISSDLRALASYGIFTEGAGRCFALTPMAELLQSSSASLRPLSDGDDYAGFSGNDGGIVIDLGSMNAIEIHREDRRTSVQPGVLIGQLYNALGKEGVTAVSGACPSVGIGGLTTGGGEGWISNKYGTASDNVVDAEIVTADGKVIHASSGDYADLFWAIRGGSGNFGVVTRFGFRAIPVARVMKGSLAFPSSRCGEVLRFWRGFAEEARDELTLGINYGIPG